MSGARRRVLVIVQGPLGDRPAGPEIRGWEIARAFAARHDVTVAATVDEATERDGIPVVPRTRTRLLAEARSHDVVVGPLLPPYLMTALARRPCVRVADLYDPVDLELGTLDGGRRNARAVLRQRALRRLQLRWADVVVCANERQRTRTLADLHTSGRPGTDPALVTVPMGLPEPPLAAGLAHPLRTHFGIEADDPLVLWWGTVWRWLDAETAIRAVDLLRRSRPDIRLVITAGAPSNRATDPLNATAEARALAASLGLLDRHVFFLDAWVPFEERGAYLGDADVGITLHGSSAEAPLAARARYPDYVWASLPSVLAEGDEFAGEMAAAGAARLVRPGDPTATAAALDRLVSDPAANAAARAACEALARRYRWSTLLTPLVDAVEATVPTVGSLRTAGESGRFYASRLIDVGAGAG